MKEKLPELPSRLINHAESGHESINIKLSS